MAASTDDALSWRDRIAIARHEISCLCIIAADILDRHDATEPDWQRLTLALHRMRALLEEKT